MEDFTSFSPQAEKIPSVQEDKPAGHTPGLDDELIQRGLRMIQAYDAVRILKEALSATVARTTGYDWNADPDLVTKQQGDAFTLADKVFADLKSAVDACPEMTDEEWAAETEPCCHCNGDGKIVEEARTSGANQHSACQRDCDFCGGVGRVPAASRALGEQA